MFQTWPNLLLQSFASEPITWFMLRVSDMGYESFYATLLAILIFGVSFRRGFLLLQLLLWSALLNSVFKDVFALPRPVHVDSNVLNNGAPSGTPFTSMGASSFFGGLPQAVIDHVRAVVPPGGDEYGLPSGHVQSTTVLWGSSSILWDQGAIRRLAPFVIVLMAISRLYLGRHFLADVLGGAALGGLVVLAFGLARRWAWDTRMFDRTYAAFRAALPNVAVWLLLVGAPLAITPFYPGRGGAMLGTGAGLLMVMRGGLPDDSGTWSQRVARVAVALLLFVAASGFLEFASHAAGLGGDAWWVDVVTRSVPSFVMIWGTVVASTSAGLYRARITDAAPAGSSRSPAGSPAHRTCPWWLGPVLASPLRKLFESPEPLLRTLVLPGMTVVEPGCGMGFFTLPLARLVGPNGRVVCVDLQSRMIDGLRRRARRAGLLDRIQASACSSDDIGLQAFAGSADVAVALHMLHEVPDRARLLGQLSAALRPGGLLLIVEPKGHVSPEDFANTVALALRAGFTRSNRTVEGLALSAVLSKPGAA